MLDFSGNDVVSLVLISLSRRNKRPVIRLGTAVRKINLVRLRSQCPGNRLPRMSNGFLGFCRKIIHGRGVSVKFRKIRKHRIYNLRPRLCRSCIVQINNLFHNKKSAFLLICSNKGKSFIYASYYIVKSRKYK